MNIITRRISRIVGAREAAPDAELQAVWNGTVLAQSDNTVVIEGNHYFPPDDVKFDYLEVSDKRTTCPWKGLASYYDVVVEGKRNDNAAWHYPEPSHQAAQIKDHVAFWNGVEVKATASV